MVYMIFYYDCCACVNKNLRFETLEKANKGLKTLVSKDITNNVEIYECKKMAWDTVIRQLTSK